MAALLLLLQQAQINVIDGLSMYHVTEALVTRHSFQVLHDAGAIPGVGGSYSKYGLGLPIVSIPAFLVGDLAAHVVGHTDYVRQAFVASTMPLIGAGLVVALYVFGRRLGGSVGASLLVAVGTVVGTYVLPYTKDFFAEPLTALALVVALERMARGRPAVAAAALGFAILCRPQELLLVPAFLGGAAFVFGMRRTAAPAAILALATGVVLGYNALRFGSPLDTGYHGEGFTTPPWTGLAGLLLNPDKSLLVFAPISILLPLGVAAAWRSKPVVTAITVYALCCNISLAATWHSWEGGWSWGPRLLIPAFVPAMPLLALWLTSKRRTWLAVALFAAGFAISAPTLVAPTDAQLMTVPQPFPGPSVVGQLRAVPDVVAYTLRHWRDPVHSGAAQHERFVNLWQVGVLRLLGRPGLLVAAAGSIVLLAVLVVALRALRRAGTGTRATSPVVIA